MEDVERKRLIKGKKAHPREKANFLSSVFFCWVFPIFFKGFKKDLTEDDLYAPLKSHKTQVLGKKLSKVWHAQTREKSLRRTLIKTFYKEFFFYVFFMIIQELAVKVTKPVLIGKLLEYWNQKQDVPLSEAYYYAGGLILFSFMDVILLHYSFFGLQHLSVKIQASCRYLIYEKALKLSKGALAEGTVGQTVNLISSDIASFQFLCMHLHQVFTAPLQIIIILYLLFLTVDSTAMVGVGVMIVFIPCLYFSGKLTTKYTTKAMKKTDNRLVLMNEVISGIQIIKMFSWEKPFAKIVQQAREMEIRALKAHDYVEIFYLVSTWVMVPCSLFLAVLTYVMTGKTPDAQFIYVTSSFYATLIVPLIFLPTAVTVLAETFVSLSRIQTFLLRDQTEVQEKKCVDQDKLGVLMENVNTKWSRNSDSLTLKKINFNAGKGLTAIVGRVGSGKTALLFTILQETFLETGSLNLQGTISYASQEPWLFSSSIRQNILFCQEMDEVKYEKVVEVCALQEDFLLLPFGDRTVVGERGVMLSGGQKARINLARAIYKEADIYLLDDPLSAVDVIVGKKIFEECVRGYLAKKCVVLVTHQLQYLGNVGRIFVMENGTIKANGSYQELKALDGDFNKMLEELGDGSQEETEKNEERTEKIKDKSTKTDVPVETKEQATVGNVPRKVYLKYFQMGGSCFLLFMVISIFLVIQFFETGIEYFLAFWVNLEQKKQSGETEETFFTPYNLLYIYGCLILLLIISVVLRGFILVQFSLNAAKRLHNFMFNSVVCTSLRFFNTNPSGRILNRFSRDITVVDRVLPRFLATAFQVLIGVLGIIIIVASVNYWIILPSLICFVLLYGYKVVFLATSRNVKRIEGRTNSPIFSHFTASLQGLSTIRAFNAEAILQKEFSEMHDINNSACHMMYSCNRTFSLWLDMSCIVYVGIVILSFLLIGKEIYIGNVGLAITQSIYLTGMLQIGIRQFSEVENQMTSVERILEYTELPPEINDGKKVPPKDWPQEGNITFSKVSMKYYEEGQYVLKNLNFNINSKEKIGIVGRTGAGKSSLISALFRLAQIEGQIFIGDLDISTIPLEALRSQIAIIPQEPVLFSGPLRKNLDPFDEYGDEELWKALEEVEMKKPISDLAGGLSTKLSEGGSNFSVGEKQLLCLARAIVRKNNILVMDEATANVDLQTDELIQKTIREKFEKCTVLTVAHRLNTVMDSDRILVLDAGEVVQFGSPWLLLQDEEGDFHSLVRQTGKAMADRLSKIAQENYKRSSK